jgi:hypothetical protein
MKPNVTGISILDVLGAIRDGASQCLFNALATDVDDHNLVNRLKITRKQYYTRIERLVKAGLVKRKDGRFYITSFGSVIYEVQLKFAKAVENYWKLKVIDSINPDNQIPQTERTKIVNGFIEDPDLKEMILTLNKSS